MGVNIGIIVIFFIIGFKFGEYVLFLIFFGIMFFFFIKNRIVNNIGCILFGVGGIFYVFNFISVGMSFFKDLL